ncbi:MAG: DUF503 domain-containing protein [Oscillospiraceae bacterium]|nr:DUF503 domain-containing protein [Oscillospiraceae bacterium]
MYIAAVKLTFYISQSNSLKNKRQVCRSLVDRARQKFNASVAEVGTQELHKILTIGVAVISGEKSHAQQSIDEIIRFMDENTDAELTEVAEI